MKKNFNIKDGVVFEFAGESLDLRGACELASVEFCPGKSSSLQIKWRIERSNHQVQIIFSSVEDFRVRGRDLEYPVECGAMLAISGFSDGVLRGGEDQFYIEPTGNINYMSFLMDDMSAFLVKAKSATMRRV